MADTGSQSPVCYGDSDSFQHGLLASEQATIVSRDVATVSPMFNNFGVQIKPKFIPYTVISGRSRLSLYLLQQVYDAVCFYIVSSMNRNVDAT